MLIKSTLLEVPREEHYLKVFLFDIDYTDISIPEYCPLLGIKLNKAYWRR